MKKFLILAVAALLGLVSCSKELQLIGTWELTSIESEGVTVDAAKFGMVMTVTFKADGVATLTLNGETESTTYAVSGNTLTLDGETFPFTISGKTLTLTMTEDGEVIKMIFTQK